MKKILVIDDDKDNLELISEMVSSSFQPICAASGREGIQLAVREQPDLILLDVNMPEMDGFEVCARLREQMVTRRIPIIMLTNAADLDYRVKGLDVGADDYITKPFQVRELMARIQARIRRFELDRKATEDIQVGNLRMQPKSAQVWVNEQPVKLTGIEFDLLRYFIEHKNELIDRNQLLGDLWPDAVVTNRTVDTHMANLRKKIKGFDCPFETVYGSGYILRTSN